MVKAHTIAEPIFAMVMQAIDGQRDAEFFEQLTRHAFGGGFVALAPTAGQIEHPRKRHAGNVIAGIDQQRIAQDRRHLCAAKGCAVPDHSGCCIAQCAAHTVAATKSAPIA